ncbi:MAG: VOC family protein [Candidatus Binatia bacterium]
MAQIRHLAIRTENPEKLAGFYIEVFGFKELHRGSHPGHAQGKTSAFDRRLLRARAPRQLGSAKSKRSLSFWRPDG